MNHQELENWIEKMKPPVVHPPYCWQSIETAPKDGHLLDLWVSFCCFGRQRSERMTDCYWSETRQEWLTHSSYPVEQEGINITHWIRIGNPTTNEKHEKEQRSAKD